MSIAQLRMLTKSTELLMSNIAYIRDIKPVSNLEESERLIKKTEEYEKNKIKIHELGEKLRKNYIDLLHEKNQIGSELKTAQNNLKMIQNKTNMIIKSLTYLLIFLIVVSVSVIVLVLLKYYGVI